MLPGSFLKFYWLSIYNKIMTKKSLEKDVIRTLKKYTFGPTHGAWLDFYTFCMKTYGIPSNIFVTQLYMGRWERNRSIFNFKILFCILLLHAHICTSFTKNVIGIWYIFIIKDAGLWSLFSLALFYYFEVILYPDYLLCSFDTHVCIYSCTHKYIRVYYYYNFFFPLCSH